MKRLLMLIPLVLLCCLGCQQGGEVSTLDVEADIQAIKDLHSNALAAKAVPRTAFLPLKRDLISIFASNSNYYCR